MTLDDTCPKVDVIIPAYNAEEFVLDGIASVLAQSYPNIGIIVVDNASTDRTAAIVKAEQVVCVYEAEKGSGLARTRGVSETKSDFLFFLDADDLLTSNAISSLMSEMSRIDADFSYGRIVNRAVGDDSTDHLKAASLVLEEGILAPLASNTLVNRRVFEKYGPFPPDNFSWPRWITSCRDAGANMGTVDELVAIRRIHDKNISLGGAFYKDFFTLIRERLSSKSESQGN